ncbi:hypothetical protein MVES_002703 [Malassezia vespertilionis]|uniref:Bas1p n=1 Tax=Malassezia vespertilionis TaxID=2020962 RepID=A0A2N1JAK9_9BASI|nr:hypothetical protein MVES_002703 [Malassezia vespertilionis]
MSFSDGRVPMKGIDRKKWALEEDELLTRTMMQYQNRNDVRWTDVSPHIPGRSAKACRKRWVNGLNDCLKKGSWTKEEDASLREGVELFNCDWSRIAQHVSHRSGDQFAKSSKAKQENRNQPETSRDVGLMTPFSSSTEDVTTPARNDAHEKLSNGHHFPGNQLDNSTLHTPNVNTAMTMPPFYQLHDLSDFQTGHEQKENERATGVLKSLQNVQGFSSISHKDPPAALNLGQLQSLCIPQDNMFPECNPNDSLFECIYDAW